MEGHKPRHVESPVFAQRYLVADNHRIVDACCPIDGTQLVAIREYDFSAYRCQACDAWFRYGDNDSASLRAQAEHYVAHKRAERDGHIDQISKIERILDAATKSGIK